MSTMDKLRDLIAEFNLPTITERELYSLVRDMDFDNESDAVELLRDWCTEGPLPGGRFPTTPAEVTMVVMNYERPRAVVSLLRGHAITASRVHEHYKYISTWSEEDEQFVGRCAEFPSLSHLDDSCEGALIGIKKLVASVVADMRKNGELPPIPALDADPPLL